MDEEGTQLRVTRRSYDICRTPSHPAAITHCYRTTRCRVQALVGGSRRGLDCVAVVDHAQLPLLHQYFNEALVEVLMEERELSASRRRELVLMHGTVIGVSQNKQLAAAG